MGGGAITPSAEMASRWREASSTRGAMSCLKTFGAGAAVRGLRLLGGECLPRRASSVRPRLQAELKGLEVSGGFEPPNNGFADRPLGPLGHDTSLGSP